LMPYEGEFAGYTPIKRIAENRRVRDLLAKYEVLPAPLVSGSFGGGGLTEVTTTSLPRRIGWTPEYVISVDGSLAETPVDNGYPGAEVGYLTIATVLLNLKKMKELDAKRPVDPAQFRETRNTTPVDDVLPGCNVVFNGETSPAASLRRAVINLFANQQAFGTGETLLDTYHVLLNYKPAAPQNCPYSEGCGNTSPEGAYQRGVGTYTCVCPLGLPFHSTDALRFHERFNDIGKNGEVFAEIMQVVERVWLVHVLRGLEAQGHLNALTRLAVVMDGPLAVFGQPAWISQAIYKELKRINNTLRNATGTDMLIIGVEKTGFFVEHFERLCKASDKRAISLNIGPQMALLPTDEYIKKQIIYSDGKKPYGEATYFGRKLFYKTRSGARIVATLPFLEDNHRDLTTALPEQYPRLADALNVFDELVSSQFPNALIPITLAHSQAAIPLSLGTKVLEKLARELIGS
jgi:hypothetical protein